jgi:hypothetical protein
MFNLNISDIIWLKMIPFEKAQEKGMRLNFDEGVMFGKNVYLAPWTNVFYEFGDKSSKGLGWHDSRIWYPKKEIKIMEDLYVLDTSVMKTIEARALLVHRDLKKGIKTPKEIAKYLLKKESRARYMTNGRGDKIYTSSFDEFIVSISPTHYLHFGENELLAKDVAIGFQKTLKDLLDGRNPQVRRDMESYLRKN